MVRIKPPKPQIKSSRFPWHGPKGLGIAKPEGYELVYDMASKLTHGQPLQLAVSENAFKQWRERFIIDGLVIKACEDLLRTTYGTVNLSPDLLTKVDQQVTRLKEFWENRLKPAHTLASKKELA